MGVVGSRNMRMKNFRPFSVQCHTGVIRYTCLNMACNSKTASRRAKLSEIRELWAVVICI